MRALTTPRAVLFDLGGTLLREVGFDPATYADALAGVAAGRVRPLVEELVREFRGPSKDGPVEVRMASCLRHLNDRLGIPLGPSAAEAEEAFWRATSRMEPEPGVAGALEALGGRGLLLGVVSNSMFGGAVLRGELDRHGLGRHFGFVLSSADYGLRKPHPSLFRTALARLGLPAGDVWFVGDSFPNDVLGAAGVGMVPLWYNPDGLAPPPDEGGGGAPAREFRRWDELPGWLAGPPPA
jgi:HAD superfamily hydrolase (TIGR01509 family)